MQNITFIHQKLVDIFNIFGPKTSVINTEIINIYIQCNNAYIFCNKSTKKTKFHSIIWNVSF